MRRLLITLLSLASSVVATTLLIAPAASAAPGVVAGAGGKVGASAAPSTPLPHATWSGLPSAVPSTSTPWVQNGSVQSFAQVGTTMVAGGNFTSVTNKGGGTVFTRNSIFAFDTSTNQVSTTFAPVLNGVVNHLLAGPVPGTVFAAGTFTNVNGTPASHVVLLDVNTGAIVSSFKAATTNGAVQTIQLSGNRLFVGGNFKTVGGIAHAGLATLDASTGALDPYMGVQMTGDQRGGVGTQAAQGVFEMSINSPGDRLAVIGNFTSADGSLHHQLAMITLGPTSASVTPDWGTSAYNPNCSSGYDQYIRGIDFSPNGQFFVVAATGGYGNNTLCDSAARWETYASGTSLSPTWVDFTGKDTLWGVAITNDVVFIGGHNRWMNNPSGTDSAAAGAVPRPGLSALDPLTGEPLAWNPGRNPRGVSAKVFLPTDTGIWMGMDTDYVGNFQYHTPKLAFFPLNGGRPVATNFTGSLPSQVFLGGHSGDSTGSISNVSLDAAGNSGTPGTLSGTGIDWSQVRGAVMVGGHLFYGYTDGFLYERSFDGSTFGAAVKIDPYHDPYWSNVNTGSGQTYVGVSPPLYSLFKSGTVTGMAYANGLLYYTVSNDSSLHSVAFSPDSGIVSPKPNNYTTGGFAWKNAQGMFVSGSTLYVASALTGSLNVVALGSNGAPTGTSTVVNSTVDWRAKGLFLSSAGQNEPPNASFVFNCPPGGTNCSFDASSSSDPTGTITSYQWNFGDGNSETDTSPKTSHIFPATGSPFTVTLTVTDNKGRSATNTQQVSVTTPPNQPPTASFTVTGCTGLTCSFDGSASSDPDGGTITSYSWDFGDQTSAASGATLQHAFPSAGQYTVTLTVTDSDGGATGSTSKVINVGSQGTGVSFGDATSVAQTQLKPTVTAPTSIIAGDRLLLISTVNDSTVTATAPTGWSLLGSQVSKTMATTVWTEVAGGSEGGNPVSVTLSRTGVKSTLTVADYHDAGGNTPTFVSNGDLASGTQRTTPTISTSTGSWLVSYWAGKGGSSTSPATTWTAPGTTAPRTQASGTQAGQVSSLLADSNGSALASTAGGLTATSSISLGMATEWSILLIPDGGTPPANQPPTAAFTSSCAGATCTFDGSGSKDTDGTVVRYDWDFGDGTPVETDTTTGTSHPYSGSGGYTVTLTVTDNGGAQSTPTGHTVTVTVPTPGQVAFVGAAGVAVNAKAATVTVPSGVAVNDRLLLVLSTNSPARTNTPPAGWTKLGTNTANTLATTVWTKTAVSGDAGSKVKVAFSGSAKATLTVVDYTGASTTTQPTFTVAQDTTSKASHTTPSISAPDKAWVVSYWADKSGTTTKWTPPGTVTSRQQNYGTLSGRVTSLLADTNGPVSAGTRAGVTATTNTPATMATMWSIVVPAGT
ncbi:MAG: PKD domain-containing protein [Nocardioidaceae bacterium]